MAKRPDTKLMMSDKLPDALCQYEVLKTLGNGCYGCVAEVTKDGKNFAMKVMAKVNNTEQGTPYSSVREIMFLGELLKCPNVVQMETSHFADPFCFIVLEKATGDILEDMPKGAGYPLDAALSIMKQILNGLKHCHSKSIVHRDLKPQNVLMFPGGTVKICDFGMARRAEYPPKPTTREVVTMNYRAPELLMSPVGITQPPIDIWSAGCILFELASGHLLFRSSTEVAIIIEIFRTLGTPTPEIWPGLESLEYYNKPWPRFKKPAVIRFPKLGYCSDLLLQMLTYDPMERPTAAELLRAWFQS
eukprot:TRINITY_DN17122_c0_g1_i1.p1 TRINITY_DN17122_c0_g1~~TRINITY_DN17122_c0_g1_i1.p1  ORF type:complete len:320 (+),score=43.54 TRINITY_DN17122_c0_g1_i1:52-960(+)